MKKNNIKKIFLPLMIIPLLTSCNLNSGVDYHVNYYRLTMDFHEDFKILQITDLHFGIESDLALQFKVVKNSITEANPDLIILTGDNFMYASKAIVDQTYNFFNECCKELTNKNNRVTKFAVTYGNHDNQGDYSRYYLNQSLRKYVTTNGNEIKDNKFALFVDYDDDNLFGFTNYFIDLVDEDNKDDVLYRLHIVDSNTYVNKGITYGYDVIREEQLDHMVDIYNNSSIDKDYIGLAFFHIPLLNYKEAIEQYYESDMSIEKGQGSFLDKEHFPYKDNGSYQKMKQANIIGYFCGHDHKNYGDLIYDDKDGDKALFSYGVKSTNQLYHDIDQIGYKLINLKKNITKDEFLDMTYIKDNILNVLDKGVNYDD